MAFEVLDIDESTSPVLDTDSPSASIPAKYIIAMETNNLKWGWVMRNNENLQKFIKINPQFNSKNRIAGLDPKPPKNRKLNFVFTIFEIILDWWEAKRV